MVLPIERLNEEGGERGLQVAAGKPRRANIPAVGFAAIIALLAIFLPEALFENRKDERADQWLPRIVVLPFENLGPPEDEYFADGITEEITSRLAAVSSLQVISRTSAMHYKGKNLPLHQIGEELDVGYALEGAIRLDRSSGSHGCVRITPQLIKVDDDTHLWSERYDRVLEDIFAVQSDIAEQVITCLETTILEP
jgi:TolB-like protein